MWIWVETAEVKRLVNRMATEKRTEPEPWCAQSGWWRSSQRQGKPRENSERLMKEEYEFHTVICQINWVWGWGGGLWVGWCGSWWMVLVDQAQGPQRARQGKDRFLRAKPYTRSHLYLKIHIHKRKKTQKTAPKYTRWLSLGIGIANNF